jgi:hypothetical protein
MPQLTSILTHFSFARFLYSFRRMFFELAMVNVAMMRYFSGRVQAGMCQEWCRLKKQSGSGCRCRLAWAQKWSRLRKVVDSMKVIVLKIGCEGRL